MSSRISGGLNSFFEELDNALVSTKSQNALSQGIHIQKVKKKASLIRHGEVCQHVYYIIKGGFVCRYYNEEIFEGKTVDVFLQESHPFMTCADSYITGEPTSFELKALSHSVVASYPIDGLKILMEDDPQLSKYTQRIFLKSLLGEMDFRIKLVSMSATRLYEHILMTNPLLIKKVPSKYIAEFLGVSPEWLTKIKNRIQNS